jgi:hypothetical protein
MPYRRSAPTLPARRVATADAHTLSLTGVDRASHPRRGTPAFEKRLQRPATMCGRRWEPPGVWTPPSNRCPPIEAAILNRLAHMFRLELPAPSRSATVRAIFKTR